MNIKPEGLIDWYKASHPKQYPEGTQLVFSNLTPRKSRIKGVDSMTFFGLQYFLKEYLVKQWNQNFFGQRLDYIIKRWKRRTTNSLGADSVDLDLVAELWELGYLPLEIMALPEGAQVPIGVPPVVMWNTRPEQFWLTNNIETIMSCSTWQGSTSATLAREYYKEFMAKALKTTGNTDFVKFQAHDFSMRGMSSLESAVISGSAHLLYFNGSDTVPAIDFLEEYYDADSDREMIGVSVPATEHSVMCMGGKEDEIGTFKRLLDLYPKGILSVVSDTWDFWAVLTDFLPKLKDQIMARDGKLVIRPDSGDPVEIICGDNIKDISKDKWCPKGDLEGAKEYMREEIKERVREETPHGEQGEYDPKGIFKYEDKYYEIQLNIDWNRHDKQYYYMDGSKIVSFNEVFLTCVQKGAVELLWDLFGGTISEQGYKVLDPHIGLIYGDSITLERAREINRRLEAKGFASTNWVAGVGSYTYQMNTRDTFGFAVKATYGEVLREGVGDEPTIVLDKREIFKDPKTDDGTKKSAKGLIAVTGGIDTPYKMWDGATWEQVKNCAYRTVFRNSGLVNPQCYKDIAARAKAL